MDPGTSAAVGDDTRPDLAPPLSMRVLVDSMSDAALVIDTKGLVRFANRTAELQLGYGLRDWLGRSFLGMVHPEDIPGVLSSIDAMQGKAIGTPVEVRIRDAHGAWHWYEVIGTSVVLDDGDAGILCMARNITQRRMWEVASSDITRFQQVVQVAPAITLLLDEHGIVTSVNAAFTRMLGHDQTKVVGCALTSFVAEGDVGSARAALHKVLADGRSGAFEARMTMAGGERTRPVRFELVNYVADPVVAGIVVSGYDITELNVVREELEYLAGHDQLTGVATRAQLLRHLESQLRSRQQFAVLFIDLDRFKPVNDLWGHETGDEILRLVGRRLEQSLRPLDLVARVGGDEFVVVAHDVSDAATARALADSIEASISLPYDVGAGPIRIGASVGISVRDDLATSASLLADADLAMYDAKSERRGLSARSVVERKRSATERRRLADEFAKGLTRGEIVSYLQPIVETRTGQLIGLEALARWMHPELGVLAPAAFMGIVEDAGLDVELGDAVLESACAAMEQLASAGLFPDLAINLSVGQLADPDLANRVARTVARYGLTPSQLVVEITEKAILASPLSPTRGASADQTLRALHAMGAKLSLDDFGTGYSSLTHVRRFPLSAIKIDQSFVDGMCTHAEDHAVVEVVIGLGRALNLLVVAEGVETQAQLDALADVGCDQVQGHLVAEPMPADAMIDWVTRTDDGADTSTSILAAQHRGSHHTPRSTRH